MKKLFSIVIILSLLLAVFATPVWAQGRGKDVHARNLYVWRMFRAYVDCKIIGASLSVGTGKYMNFGTTIGSTGYGFQDDSGTIKIKDSGGSWSAIQGQIDGKQPLDSGLTDISGLGVADGNFIVGDNSNWIAESGNTARTSLGLGSGDSPTFAGSTMSSSIKGISLFVDQDKTDQDSYGIYIDSESLVDPPFYANMTDGKAITQLGHWESAIGSNWFYRNAPYTDTRSPVVFIEQDHADDNHNALMIQQDGSGDYINAGTFRVEHDGIVGIGSSVSNRMLNVTDDTYPQIRLTQTHNVNYVDLTANSSGDLVIEPSSGKVGINTAPNAELTISNGTDEFDFDVQTNWLKIVSATSDGSDDQSISIGGGGDSSSARGGYITISGNEGALNGGFEILAGRGQGDITLWTSSAGSTSQVMTIKGGSNKYVGLNTTSPDTLFEISNDGSSAIETISTYHDAEATAPTLTLRKADNTEASPQPIDSGAVLGIINFNGYDDNSFDNGSRIYAKADANWGASERGTDLYFATRDGNGALTDHFKITAGGAFQGETSKWWMCQYIPAYSLAVGGSGATETPPDANTLGGFELDVNTEYLYTTGRACNDWDGASDLRVRIVFEVYVDNSGGGSADTVDLQLLCYMKGDAETATKLQTVENAITVGQSPQYKQFESIFTIDYDDGSNPVDVDDIISFRLNLETDTSEVDDVMINFIHFEYKTAKPRMEI